MTKIPKAFEDLRKYLHKHEYGPDRYFRRMTGNDRNYHDSTHLEVAGRSIGNAFAFVGSVLTQAVAEVVTAGAGPRVFKELTGRGPARAFQARDFYDDCLAITKQGDPNLTNEARELLLNNLLGILNTQIEKSWTMESTAEQRNSGGVMFYGPSKKLVALAYEALTEVVTQLEQHEKLSTTPFTPTMTKTLAYSRELVDAFINIKAQLATPPAPSSSSTLASSKPPVFNRDIFNKPKFIVNNECVTHKPLKRSKLADELAGMHRREAYKNREK